METPGGKHLSTHGGGGAFTTSVRYRFDAFIFDPADGRLEHVPDGRAVQLRPQVSLFLLTLLQSPRTVIDRDRLRRAVWGEHAVVDFESGLAAIVRELRQALDQFGGRAGLLETIPRRGYRLSADVIELGAPGPSAAPTAAAMEAPREPRRRRRLPVIVLLGALVIGLGLALLVAAVAWWKPAAVAPALPGQALAVLPFEYYEGGDVDGRRNGLLLADSLLAALWEAALPDVTLIGRASLLPYQGREDVAAAVAADLGVELLIEGGIARHAGEWQVTARLLRMPGGEVAWSESLAWPERAELPIRDSAALLVESLAQSWHRDRGAVEDRPSRD